MRTMMTLRTIRWSQRGSIAGALLLAMIGLVLPLTVKAQEARGGKPADTVTAHVGRGYELVKDERYREAATEFQAALALDPNYVRARYQLAVCWFALFKFPEARGEFNRLRRDTGDDPMVAYYLGRIDLSEGDPGSAIRELGALTSKPPFADTFYYLGSAYMQKGDLQQAEKWLRAAVVATPRDYRVHDHLARVYQKEGRAADAEKEHALSSELRAHLEDASRLAVACSHSLEVQGASEERVACRQLLDAPDPDKLTILGLLYGQHGFFAEAVDPLEQAARLDPDSSEIQHDLGLTYFRLRRYKEARGALEKAVALRPDFFGSCALLGATHYALGEYALAFPVLRHAHQLDPQDQDTAQLLFNAAVVLAGREFGEKKYDSSLAYLTVAAEIRPTEPEVHRRLAQVYRLLGKHAEADREQAEADRPAQSHSQ